MPQKSQKEKQTQQKTEPDDVFVVIPAYNEARWIGDVLHHAKKYCKNIIVVDDGSRDNTTKIAAEKGVMVIRNKSNKGKGMAARRGCDEAIRRGAQSIVLMDADGQHQPEDIPRLLKTLKGKDIVFCSRSLDKNMPPILRFGNASINRIVSVLCGIKLRDTQSGYKAFTDNAYRKIRWKSKGYSLETEIINRAGRNRLNYREIKIKTIYNDPKKGTSVSDGFKIVLQLIWWKITGA
ncbi:glycosyltransferase family 2 protein [Candidatus Woesearchaeota archaeon]|nr:glycosyltransferase family 2 protein [Candidatus Woesearchaeota archaeon]